MVKKKITLVECKRWLRESAKKSLKNGYKGDAADAMFRVYVLELLEKIALKTKREPSAYNLFIAQQVGKGLTFIEAVEKWKKSK